MSVYGLLLVCNEHEWGQSKNYPQLVFTLTPFIWARTWPWLRGRTVGDRYPAERGATGAADFQCRRRNRAGDVRRRRVAIAGGPESAAQSHSFSCVAHGAIRDRWSRSVLDNSARRFISLVHAKKF